MTNNSIPRRKQSNKLATKRGKRRADKALYRELGPEHTRQIRAVLDNIPELLMSCSEIVNGSQGRDLELYTRELLNQGIEGAIELFYLGACLRFDALNREHIKTQIEAFNLNELVIGSLIIGYLKKTPH
jgi:hypothetical protein